MLQRLFLIAVSLSSFVAFSAADPPSDTLVLVSPLSSRFVYLIDSNGETLHQWTFANAGSNAYLFPDGSLMRSEQVPEGKAFDLRGQAGQIQHVDWDGNVLWDYKYADDSKLQHHDYERLPNGNVLLIACEKKTREEAIQAGRNPDRLSDQEFYTETVVEIRPEGKTSGKEVWRWNLWDHLVQDHDPAQSNFGSPSDSPRRVDLNFTRNGRADWIHMNAIDYNARLDQIVISPRYMDELWFLDHSTTTAQAASSEGGRYGHGGDLLYRMGNPEAYGRGNRDDKLLFGHHDCRWIPDDHPGAGDITVFNNGTSPPRQGFSSADQFKLPVINGTDELVSNRFVDPTVVWSYSRGPELFSSRISGAEKLQNGNMLICSGDQPWILEVTPEKEIAWQMKRKYGGGPTDAPDHQGGAMFRAPGYSLSYFEDSIRDRLSQP